MKTAPEIPSDLDRARSIITNVQMMQGDIAELLAGPDYFRCERNHARMRKSVCLDRQEKGIHTGLHHREIPPECRDCPQGREIKAGLEKPVLRSPAEGGAEDSIDMIESAGSVESTTAGETWIIVDFEHLPELFDSLRQRAAQELRTPEQQALYFIREALHDQ